MSRSSSTVRLLLYVLIACLTQAQADLSGAFSSDLMEASKFWIGILLTAAITMRAYIDSSNSQVAKEQPIAKSPASV